MIIAILCGRVPIIVPIQRRSGGGAVVVVPGCNNEDEEAATATELYCVGFKKNYSLTRYYTVEFIIIMTIYQRTFL